MQRRRKPHTHRPKICDTANLDIRRVRGALVLLDARLQEQATGDDVALRALRQQQQRRQPRRGDRQRELRHREVPPQRLLALLRGARRLAPQLPAGGTATLRYQGWDVRQALNTSLAQH